MVDIEQLREALDWPPNLSGSVTTVSVQTYRTIQDAARELLALKENGQTVWWCEEHNEAQAHTVGRPTCWRFASDFIRCRMVKASLHIHREGT